MIKRYLPLAGIMLISFLMMCSCAGAKPELKSSTDTEAETASVSGDEVETVEEVTIEEKEASKDKREEADNPSDKIKKTSEDEREEANNTTNREKETPEAAGEDVTAEEDISGEDTVQGGNAMEEVNARIRKILDDSDPDNREEMLRKELDSMVSEGLLSEYDIGSNGVIKLVYPDGSETGFMTQPFDPMKN